MAETQILSLFSVVAEMFSFQVFHSASHGAEDAFTPLAMAVCPKLQLEKSRVL